jgi:hypothetical protein
MPKVRLECGAVPVTLVGAGLRMRQSTGAEPAAWRRVRKVEGTVTMRAAGPPGRRGVRLLGWSLQHCSGGEADWRRRALLGLVEPDGGRPPTRSFAGSPVVEHSCDSALATSPARLRPFYVSPENYVARRAGALSSVHLR